MVRKAEDIQKIRELLGHVGEHIKVFARIECVEAIENFDQIIQICDGVVIMRSTLGVEIQDHEKLFVA
jgi:pyruvate kinase